MQDLIEVIQAARLTPITRQKHLLAEIGRVFGLGVSGF